MGYMGQTHVIKIICYPKKQWTVMCLLLLFLLSGCGKVDEDVSVTNQQTQDIQQETYNQENQNQEIENQKKEENLYQEYFTALSANDSLRTKLSQFPEKAWEETSETYSEVIEEGFYGQNYRGKYWNINRPEEEYMRGILTAGKSCGEASGMRIAVFAEQEWREYVYYPSEEMIYFAVYGTEKENGDIPEYRICDNVLEYYMLLDGYQNIEKDWKNLYEERLKAEINSIIYEYCAIGGRIYVIDREKGRMQDVTESSVVYMNEWLEWEYERVSHSMLVTAEVKEKLGTLIQEPNRLEEAAVCDLNKDGVEDYVAAVYGPEQGTDNGFKHPEQSMWLFLSDNEKGYKSKVLIGEKYSYICQSLKFTAHGLLRSKNMLAVGKYNSWKQEYYRYDPKMEDFYFIKSLQSKDDGIMKTNMEDIGFYTIHDFYPTGYMETEGWQRDFKYEIKDEKGVPYNVEYDVVYLNQDKNIEELVQKELFLTGKKMAEDLYSHVDEDKYKRIYIHTYYQNSSIYSGTVSDREYNTAVLIDTKLGKVLDITQMISKEKMLEICKKGMKERTRNPVSEEDMERYLKRIQESYENVNSKTPRSDAEAGKSGMSLRITAWGVWVSFFGDGEFRLDKEFFMDTALWKYMEPDFSWVLLIQIRNAV